MNDLIRREDAIDKIREVYEYEFPTASGAFDEFVTVIIPNLLRNLPSAEPERTAMVWKPAKGRPVYEIGICSCGYVLTVLQRDFVYCPKCGAKLEWCE